MRKATGFRIDFSASNWFRCPRLEQVAAACSSDEAERPDGVDAEQAEFLRVTQRVDRSATLYLTITLGPLVLGWALKQLIYAAHKGWYSWALGSATSGVYTFGFILMTPQLVLNYKLKSVSHLPWKLLGFRFVNTFIDDLFAFVIKMPTMHRVSCFRDDFVFLIYLYQRYKYPVDTTRGTAAEDCAH